MAPPPMPLRVALMGSPPFAVPTLDHLAAAPALARLVGVVSQPDSRQGRGRRLAPAPTRAWAQRAGLPTLTPTRLRDPAFAAALAAWAPDIIVVVAYGRILPPRLLALPRFGCVNVHASLLPRLRGAAPIAHAILAGDDTAGVSIMRMDEGCDTGPVYHRRSCPLPGDATAATLAATLATLGAQALVDTLPAIVQGLDPTPQAHEQATWAPLLTKDDGLARWEDDAAQLARQVRAFDPWPQVATWAGRERLALVAATADPAASTAAAGTILQVHPEGVEVSCGAGRLWLRQVRPAGRPTMAASAWARGRGIRAGLRLASQPTMAALQAQ